MENSFKALNSWQHRTDFSESKERQSEAKWRLALYWAEAAMIGVEFQVTNAIEIGGEEYWKEGFAQIMWGSEVE